MTFDEIKNILGKEHYQKLDGDQIHQLKEMSEALALRFEEDEELAQKFLNEIKEILETRDVLKIVDVELWNQYKSEKTEHLYYEYLQDFAEYEKFESLMLDHENYDFLIFLDNTFDFYK